MTYTSFAEKIKAIGRITNSGTEYNSVKINDADFDYKYINKIKKTRMCKDLVTGFYTFLKANYILEIIYE